jgi:hypothetical protein
MCEGNLIRNAVRKVLQPGFYLIRDIFCVGPANGTLDGYGIGDFSTQSAMYSGIQNVNGMPKVIEMRIMY